MTLISAGELAAIQSVARSGMTGTATLLTRATVETDDGQESVWATSGLDVPCWVREITAQGTTLGAVAGQVGISENFSIRIPIGNSVAAMDHIVVGDSTYVVQHVNVDDTYPAWMNTICRSL